VRISAPSAEIRPFSKRDGQSARVSLSDDTTSTSATFEDAAEVFGSAAGRKTAQPADASADSQFFWLNGSSV